MTRVPATDAAASIAADARTGAASEPLPVSVTTAPPASAADAPDSTRLATVPSQRGRGACCRERGDQPEHNREAAAARQPRIGERDWLETTDGQRQAGRNGRQGEREEDVQRARAIHDRSVPARTARDHGTQRLVRLRWPA